jgi:hypothetical protein
MNFVHFGIKSCIFGEVYDLWISGSNKWNFKRLIFRNRMTREDYLFPEGSGKDTVISSSVKGDVNTFCVIKNLQTEKLNISARNADKRSYRCLLQIFELYCWQF